eukprot:6180022-Pleurochrysis_carterae.AAC.1
MQAHTHTPSHTFAHLRTHARPHAHAHAHKCTHAQTRTHTLTHRSTRGRLAQQCTSSRPRPASPRARALYFPLTFHSSFVHANADTHTSTTESARTHVCTHCASTTYVHLSCTLLVEAGAAADVSASDVLEQPTIRAIAELLPNGRVQGTGHTHAGALVGELHALCGSGSDGGSDGDSRGGSQSESQLS